MGRKKQIRKLYNRNIVSGYPGGTFKPQDNVSRAEFVKMIVSIGFDEFFTDVSEDSECYSSVAYALERGWLLEGDTFSPDAPASLDFAVEMGVNAIGTQEYAANLGYENVAQINKKGAA